MAHHRLAHEDSAAIFSPSVARIAASTARDWSYVESWLASKFPGCNVSPFERNRSTLKALLALVASNESADEECRLLADVDTMTLRDLRSPSNMNRAALDTGSRDSGSPTESAPGLSHLLLRDRMLKAIEDSLPKEGAIALNSLARSAVQTGTAFPEPETLARAVVALQSSIDEAEQTTDRLEIFGRHVEAELADADGLLRNLQDDLYRPSHDLAKQNLDLQRRVKAMSTRIPELQSHDQARAIPAAATHPSINDIARDEQHYIDLLVRKKDLDAQIATFQNLPSNPEMARVELETLRRDLLELTSRRDVVFEGLVERESPVRRR